MLGTSRISKSIRVRNPLTGIEMSKLFKTTPRIIFENCNRMTELHIFPKHRLKHVGLHPSLYSQVSLRISYSTYPPFISWAVQNLLRFTCPSPLRPPPPPGRPAGSVNFLSVPRGTLFQDVSGSLDLLNVISMHISLNSQVTFCAQQTKNEIIWILTPYTYAR